MTSSGPDWRGIDTISFILNWARDGPVSPRHVTAADWHRPLAGTTLEQRAQGGHELQELPKEKGVSAIVILWRPQAERFLDQMQSPPTVMRGLPGLSVSMYIRFDYPRTPTLFVIY